MRRSVDGTPVNKPSGKPAPVSTPSEDTSNYDDLKKDIESAYNGSVTIEEAEKLAAKFLSAQMEIAEKLSSSDLDARMKKNGLKVKRSTVYMTEATKGEKKPSEGYLENHVTMDFGVQSAVEDYERADAERESLTLYLGIFKDAHIYFRGISKGRYE